MVHVSALEPLHRDMPAVEKWPGTDPKRFENGEKSGFPQGEAPRIIKTANDSPFFQQLIRFTLTSDSLSAYIWSRKLRNITFVAANIYIWC